MSHRERLLIDGLIEGPSPFATHRQQASTFQRPELVCRFHARDLQYFPDCLIINAAELASMLEDQVLLRRPSEASLTCIRACSSEGSLHAPAESETNPGANTEPLDQVGRHDCE